MLKLSANAKLFLVTVLLLGVIAMKVYGEEVARVFCQTQINSTVVYYGNSCPFFDQVLVGADFSNPHQPMVKCGRIYVSCF